MSNVPHPCSVDSFYDVFSRFGDANLKSFGTQVGACVTSGIIIGAMCAQGRRCAEYDDLAHFLSQD
jgi:hypothetical protein